MAIQETIERIPGGELAGAARFRWLRGDPSAIARLLVESGGLLWIVALSRAAAAAAGARTPRSLASPRWILRITAPIAIVPAIASSIVAAVSLIEWISVRPGHSSREPFASVLSILGVIEQSTSAAQIPFFIAAVLFGRSVARAAGLVQTDVWIARALWLAPLLITVVPSLWYAAAGGFGLLTGVPVETIFTVSLAALFLAIAIAIWRALRSPAAEMETARDRAAASPQPPLVCPACGYDLAALENPVNCPECGVVIARAAACPAWTRFAFIGAAIVVASALGRIVVWGGFAIISSGQLYASITPPGMQKAAALAAGISLLSVAGWWLIVCVAVPHALTKRERRLRIAAGAGIILITVVHVGSAALTLTGTTFGFAHYFTLVYVGLAVGLALWWLTGAGRIIRMGVELNDRRLTRISLIAFWLLPVLIVSGAVASIASLGVVSDIWATAYSLVSLVIERPDDSFFSGPEFSIYRIQRDVALAVITLGAILYLAMMLSILRATRRARRHSRAIAP
jgi:predicted RNA-binding Zn-ribbon protein involved in translation (DUF1610 family)